MELETEASKEVAIFIIGAFGLRVPIFKLINLLSVLLIVNSELSLFQYGKQLCNSQHLQIENINLNNLSLIRDMEAVLIHYENI